MDFVEEESLVFGAADDPLDSDRYYNRRAEYDDEFIRPEWGEWSIHNKTASRFKFPAFPIFPPKPKKQQKIILIGPSGAGKSSFVNALNFYMSKSKDILSRRIENNDLDLQISNLFKVPCLIPCVLSDDIEQVYGEKVATCSKHSESKEVGASQTRSITEYKFDTGDNSELVLVDTPGFGDTRGGSADDENIKLILDTFANAKNLAACIILLNGTQSRLNRSVMTAINQLKSVLPADIFSSFILVVTHVSKLTSTLPLERIFGKELMDKMSSNVLYMNNSLFASCPSRILNLNDEDEKRIIFEQLLAEDNSCKRVLKSILGKLPTLKTSLDGVFVKINEARNEFNSRLAKIEVLVAQSIEKIATTQAIVNQLIAPHVKLAKKTTLITELKLTTNYHTLCLNHFMKEACHENCTLSEKKYDGEAHFVGDVKHFDHCWAMDRDNHKCDVCDCHTNMHFHQSFLPVQKKVDIFDANQQLLDQLLSESDKIASQGNAVAQNQIMLKKLLSDLCTHAESFLESLLDYETKVFYFNIDEFLTQRLHILAEKSCLLDAEALENCKAEICIFKAILKAAKGKTLSVDERQLEKDLGIDKILAIEPSSFEIKDIEEAIKEKEKIVNGVDMSTVPKNFVERVKKLCTMPVQPAQTENAESSSDSSSDEEDETSSDESNQPNADTTTPGVGAATNKRKQPS